MRPCDPAFQAQASGKVIENAYKLSSAGFSSRLCAGSLFDAIECIYTGANDTVPPLGQMKKNSSTKTTRIKILYRRRIF
jgi:hypothetical protein